MMQPSLPSAASKAPGSKRSFTCRSVTEIPFLRKQCALFAAETGFNAKALGEISIAVSEILTNALKFGSQATLTFSLTTKSPEGICVAIVDNGPGFKNIEMALLDGYSEGRFLIEDDNILNRRGLGNGLGAVKRLTDKIKLSNQPEGGACVTFWKWLPNDSHQ